MGAGVQEEPAREEAGGTKMQTAYQAAFVGLKIGHTDRAQNGAKVLRPAYPFGGAIGPLEGPESTSSLYPRWVGGRAGTAVPRGAVCELPNPPKKTLPVVNSGYGNASKLEVGRRGIARAV